MLRSLQFLGVGALVLLAGCAAVSDFVGRPMPDYRGDTEIRALYLNRTAVTRVAVLDADTGAVVFPAGTEVLVTDVRYRPNRFPKATGEVVLKDGAGKKFTVGFTTKFKEHLVLQMNDLLAFEVPPPAEALPWHDSPAAAHAARLALLKEEFAGVPLWLVRDAVSAEGSRQPFLPAGTELRLEDASVFVTERLEGERTAIRLTLSAGDGDRLFLYLDPPMKTYAEWYGQMAEYLTTEPLAPAPDALALGTSKEAALAAWGAPDVRRGILSNEGVREEWTYALRGKTLVFEEGKLAGR